MFDVVGDINWIAVVLGVVACTVLGGAWFAGLMAKPYAMALGLDPKKKPEMNTLSYVGPMISTFFVAVTSAVLFEALGIVEFGDALIFSLVVGVGYLVATMFNVAINPKFPNPTAYAVVNAPYFLLCSVIISSIYVAIN